MNLKFLAVALSMVAAQSNNPGVDVSGSAAKMHADYEKMPVERQRRFWVSQTRLFYSIVWMIGYFSIWNCRFLIYILSTGSREFSDNWFEYHHPLKICNQHHAH